MFLLQDHGRDKQRVHDSQFCSQNIYWRSTVCCGGVRRTASTGSVTYPPSAKSNTTLSARQALLAELSCFAVFSNSNLVRIDSPSVISSVPLAAGWLIQCPRGTSTSCILLFVLCWWKGSTVTPTWSLIIHTCSANAGLDSFLSHLGVLRFREKREDKNTKQKERICVSGHYVWAVREQYRYCGWAAYWLFLNLQEQFIY